jgi:hypothetical protein
MMRRGLVLATYQERSPVIVHRPPGGARLVLLRPRDSNRCWFCAAGGRADRFHRRRELEEMIRERCAPPESLVVT